jgi:hypothetical protein
MTKDTPLKDEFEGDVKELLDLLEKAEECLKDLKKKLKTLQDNSDYYIEEEEE